MALLVGYVASPFERMASSCIVRSLQHLMLPLPGVIAPWSVGRGHDTIVQLHKKERSQEATPWPRNSMWPELDGGRIEPYILYDPSLRDTKNCRSRGHEEGLTFSRYRYQVSLQSLVQVPPMRHAQSVPMPQVQPHRQDGAWSE